MTEAEDQCNQQADCGSLFSAQANLPPKGQLQEHKHAHTAKRQQGRSRLIIVLTLTSSLVIVEFVAGIVSHSLALLADVGHMLSDIFSQVLALLSIWFASKPPSRAKSYGYYRTEILASLVNGVILIGISA